MIAFNRWYFSIANSTLNKILFLCVCIVVSVFTNILHKYLKSREAWIEELPESKTSLDIYSSIYKDAKKLAKTMLIIMIVSILIILGGMILFLHFSVLMGLIAVCVATPLINVFIMYSHIWNRYRAIHTLKLIE